MADFQACGAHLDLGRAPYVSYGVKYIDLVSLELKMLLACCAHLDVSRAPCVLLVLNVLT